MQEIIHEDENSKLLRPLLHFTPTVNWANDPNGCVYIDGLYHLFYQHNPNDRVWGDIHWGHAVSEDLLFWRHLEPVLAPDDIKGMPFSGCAVICKDDSALTAAVLNEWKKAMSSKGIPIYSESRQSVLFFYTLHRISNTGGKKTVTQSQAIALASADLSSVIPYAGNPVLSRDKDSHDFRDPTVFWHEPSSQWIMLLSAGRCLELYRSCDLLHWQLSSIFTLEGVGDHYLYECPGMIRFSRSSDSTTDGVWVVFASTIADGPLCSTVYACGEFDGTTWIQTSGTRPIDGGHEFYAMQTWTGLPMEKPVWIAWMRDPFEDFQYPDLPWRGVMSIPRSIDLMYSTDGVPILVQHPILCSRTLGVVAGCEIIPLDGTIKMLYLAAGYPYRLHAAINTHTIAEVRIEWCNLKGDALTIQLDIISQTVSMKRMHQSGATDVLEVNSYQWNNLDPNDDSGLLDFKLLLDGVVAELFLLSGTCSVSRTVYASQPFTRLQVSCSPIRTAGIEFGFEKEIQVDCIGSVSECGFILSVERLIDNQAGKADEIMGDSGTEAREPV